MKSTHTQALLLAVLLAAALPAAGQEAPLSELELIGLLQAKTPAEEIVAAVRARGVSFKLTPEIEEKLRILKAARTISDILKAPATLVVRSSAADTTVVLDGQERGVIAAGGELKLADLAHGDHVVRARAENYVEQSQSVFLKPGETRPLALTLQPGVVAVATLLGTTVRISAGTAADAAFIEVEFAREPAQRAGLLEKIRARFAGGPVELQALEMLQETHLEAQQWEAALEAGAKLLERDPRNFKARVRQVYAGLGRGDFGAAFEEAGRVHALVDDLKKPWPDVDSRELGRLWDTTREDMARLGYEMFARATTVADAGQRAGVLEGYLQLFPRGDYTVNALVALALAQQQAGKADAMLDAGTRALALDPDQPVMLVLLSDSLSERGQELARARELASRLLGLLADEPQKVRPQGLDDQQWAAQRQRWQGLARSVLGQILLHEEKFDPAVQEFKAADPLLEGEAYFKARNLFRLGYAHARLNQPVPARAALQQALALNTPWNAPVEELLNKLKPRK